MPAIAPSVIWAIDFEDGRPHFCAEGTIGCAPDSGNFRWLHLSLADEVTRRWIDSASSLPEDMRDLLLGPEQHQRSQVSDGWLGCVFHDVERDFDRLDTERTGVLRIVLGERVIVTARHHPLRSADLVRRHIERDGALVRNATDALDLVVSSIIENIGAVARSQGQVIETLEDDLLDESRAFDHRRLIHLRRRIVQFHRLLNGMRAVFKRMELDPDMPYALGPTIEKLSQQLGAIDGEMLSFHSQLRLLREEADLQATQRTNKNLYILSILTALLLPPTLVTGFFGMNTGGLPFLESGDGTLIATILAIIASGLVYWLLRVMGLDRAS
jgi:zinc transporter